ncbi:MAG TPA: right-handed parallel beta-helix repeat-containing protein, partial [Bacteroidales bacterium]|nr:right-handed parallel beta-helix repeat-containing protein [Bacteroidales bacterium]
MKAIITLIILVLGSSANATDYYISSSGDDKNNSGLSENSPWKTIDKINSEFSSFKPGDKILFKCG